MRKKERRLISCACGCGNLRVNIDSNGRQRKFINYHSVNSKRGPECYNWKGDDVTMGPLHYYIRTHFPPPKECQDCGQEKPLDAACITGIYSKDFSNWKYLCRKCHIKLDGNVRKAWITKRNK